MMKKSNYIINFEFAAPCIQKQKGKLSLHLQHFMVKLDQCQIQLDLLRPSKMDFGQAGQVIIVKEKHEN
jgi:site-specific recombinase